MDSEKTKTTRRAPLRKWLTLYATLVFYIGTTAQANAAMAAVICSILSIVQGDLGRAVGTMGVIAVAFGATLGKTSWGLAVTVAFGITLIFQASYYASFFGLAAFCP